MSELDPGKVSGYDRRDIFTARGWGIVAVSSERWGGGGYSNESWNLGSGI